MTRELPSDAWVFGYGSLMWRPDFPFQERHVGYIQGWKRRFHQGSPDHRGTPAAPGRVVTLLEDAQSNTWGVAFRLAPEVATGILETLDHREQAGYARLSLPIWAAEGQCLIPAATTWVATPGNDDHLGDAPMHDMVRQIRDASGPSGSNEEYVLALDQCLAAMDIVDDHVRTLAREIRRASENSADELGP